MLSKNNLKDDSWTDNNAVDVLPAMIPQSYIQVSYSTRTKKTKKTLQQYECIFGSYQKYRCPQRWQALTNIFGGRFNGYHDRNVNPRAYMLA